MDWTEKKAKEAEATLRKWRELTKAVKPSEEPDSEFVSALLDDLNTPKAINELHRLSKSAVVGEMMLGQDKVGQTADPAALLASARLIGLLSEDTGEWAATPTADLSEFEALLAAARETAMQTKDFSEVDRLKAAFLEAGVEVRMSKVGVELLPGTGFDASKLEALK